MVKYKLKNKWLLFLASISLVIVQKNKIEEKEELVEWEPVEKLDISKKLVYLTYPDEDFSQNINIDILEDIKEDVNENKDIVINNIKDKQVKSKKKVDDKQRKKIVYRLKKTKK